MNGFLLLGLVIFVLWIGSSIFIPLLMAIFLWYLINATATYFRKLLPKCESGCKIWQPKLYGLISHVMAIGIFVALIYVFATHVRPMLSEIVPAIPMIQMRLDGLWTYISETIGINITTDTLPSLSSIVSGLGASMAKLATSMGMVIVYMIFLFVEQSTFHRKFAKLFPNKTQSKKMQFILSSIDENMKKYLFMKTLISAITGALSYAWLYILDVPFAGVWAFSIFILSYIPTIGAIVGCAMPILFALIAGVTLNEMILLSLGLIGLQIVFGNIIEPKLTGTTLNLSTLAILINLVFWGLIWGVAGMFFSVPLLVATFIVTAQFDSTRWIAVLLSADGKIPDKNED